MGYLSNSGDSIHTIRIPLAEVSKLSKPSGGSRMKHNEDNPSDSRKSDPKGMLTAVKQPENNRRTKWKQKEDAMTVEGTDHGHRTTANNYDPLAMAEVSTAPP